MMLFFLSGRAWRDACIAFALSRGIGQTAIRRRLLREEFEVLHRYMRIENAAMTKYEEGLRMYMWRDLSFRRQAR